MRGLKMGKCPSCGKSGFLLRTHKCEMCGKEGCDNCARLLFRVFDPVGSTGPDPAGTSKKHYVCSEQCLENFAEKMEGIMEEIPNISSPDDYINGIYVSEAVASAFLATKEEKFVKEFGKRNKAIQWVYDKKRYPDKYKPFSNEFYKEYWDRHHDSDKDPHESSVGLYFKFKKHLAFLQAQNCEKAGHHEQAAQLYEQYDLYDKAGRLREKAREVRVKTTEVSVDLNKLLKQVKDGGLVVLYRCPHCDGNLKIGKDSKVEGLRHCNYCGSEIKTVDLVEYLKTALS